MLPDDELIHRTTDLLSEASALSTMDALTENTNLADDSVQASVKFIVDDDHATARTTLFPSRGTTEFLPPDTVVERLEEAGVIFGIDYEKIGEGVFLCNTERRTGYSVEVAHARPAQDAVAEHLAVVYSGDHEAPEERAGRVDHRAWSRVPIVPAGTILARVVPSVPGHNGTTVTGEPVPYLRFWKSRRTWTMAPEISNSTVMSCFTAKWPADFTINCTGTLRSLQTLDVFGVQCGALEVRKGIIGHDDATVAVDGSVKARFLQNARVQASETVSVAASVLASQVTTNEKTQMGRNSTVVGSVFRASDGVVAYNIGSPGAAATELYLGIDFDVERRLAEIRDYSLELGKQLRDVRQRLQRKSDDDQQERLLDLEQELQSAITQLGQRAGEMVPRLDRNENADLVVRGTVYTGTYVEICHRSLHVDHRLRTVVSTWTEPADP